MNWSIFLPNGSTAIIGRGVIQVRDHLGSLVIYRPRTLGAVSIGMLSARGRLLEFRG